MNPVLDPRLFVFVSFEKGARASEVIPVMQFMEKEGLTLIIEKEDAVKAGYRYEYPCRMITLNVHSSLAVVGFLAKITTRLAEAGISVNPVSAFYHDHLFVPDGKEHEALNTLNALSQN